MNYNIRSNLQHLQHLQQIPYTQYIRTWNIWFVNERLFVDHVLPPLELWPKPPGKKVRTWLLRAGSWWNMPLEETMLICSIAQYLHTRLFTLPSGAACCPNDGLSVLLNYLMTKTVVWSRKQSHIIVKRF